MEPADVLVVGDGVAGCAAAIALGRLGLSTIILRTKGSRTDADLPETLAPAGRKLLDDLLGCALTGKNFPPITTKISRWGNGAAEVASMLPASAAPSLLGKARLKSILLEMALSSGAAALKTAHIHKVERQSNIWRASVHVGGEEQALLARFAIDASGRRAVLAQRLGCRRRILDSLVSFWIVGPGEAWPRHAVATATVSDGWLFCVGSKSGNAAIGFFTAGSRCKAKPSADTILKRVETIPEMADLLRRVSDWKRSPVLTRNAATTWLENDGSDWIACGDALQTIDPVASSGTYIALRQGIAAANVAKDILGGGLSALRAYRMASKAEFDSIFAKRNQYYGLRSIAIA
ncbi:Dehydrogenase (flavoprotein) [Bradyrhizobium brasilense]|uniref:Dehydrogenase (Flavoprotein) n=1 Tax=Bradyrhizobium brasilense TaxID=1419277 RepID=A0A1G6RY04_9BRAD|nr:FAD-dependent monooxygenase [Bradyrhizobium brasilense]SDD09333.1 Dehydrogenase (flavoprotein) [Bradyrhizobium brasilense]